ncbi:zinc finger protein OZF-like [Anopheles nili]|uniref:zinc finger protein OZF-like n=1 Tax=Anopheles nili TaxID=185578 RepID=UPI00237B3BFD|nr:zinc finger protein OZF-like [Anopheles nili]
MVTVCCRICLNQTSVNDALSLFDKYENFIIRDALLEMFQIKIHPTEMLSTICKECVRKLWTVRSIRDEFLQQECKYQKMIRNSDEVESSLEWSQDELQPLCTSQEFEGAADESRDYNDVRKLEKEDEGSHSSDSNKLTYVVDNPNETSALDSDDSQLKVMILPEKSEKKLIRIEIIDNMEEKSEIDDIEDKRKTDPIPRFDDEDFSEKSYYLESADLTDAMEEHSTKEARTGHSENEIICVYCETKFDSHAKYEQHICNHTKTTSEEKAFPSKANSKLSLRSRRDSKQGISACKQIRIVEDEEQISNIPTDEGSVVCIHCSEVFESDLLLLKHGIKSHPHQFTPVQCKNCSTEFATLPAMLTHREQCSAGRYKCRFCHKKFVTSFAMKGHENTHTKEQSFSCNVCPKKFSQYSSMRRHLKLHSNEKPYKCDYCDDRFRQRGVMLVHRRRHTGEKPYGCGTCGRHFRDRSTVAKHKRIHVKHMTNAKP